MTADFSPDVAVRGVRWFLGRIERRLYLSYVPKRDIRPREVGPMEQGVVFTLEDRQFALPLVAVARVVRAVEITSLPDAPKGVCGVIDLQGELVPVVDLRGFFGLPCRELAIRDQFLVAITARRTVALWVDQVGGVVQWARGEFVDAAALVPGSRRLKGVARGEEGLMLVHDLDALLALDLAVPVEEGAAGA